MHAFLERPGCARQGGWVPNSMLLDAASVGLALKDAADIWSLADLTLYDLCQEHWGHSDF